MDFSSTVYSILIEVGGATEHTVLVRIEPVHLSVVCVCVRNANFSNRLLLRAETCNTGRSQCCETFSTIIICMFEPCNSMKENIKLTMWRNLLFN